MYQKILVGIDLIPESDYILARAKKVAAQYRAELTVVTVVEMGIVPCYDGIYAGIPMLDTTDDIKSKAQVALEKTLKQHRIAIENGQVLCGYASDEILSLAKNTASDLIIVGSHGRHGIRLLLGSTANSLLHHAKCDVLAMRLKEED